MKKSYGAISISAVYLLFGMLWIFFSDALLEKISPDLEVYAKFQTYKGWLYVIITTVLIYSLLKIYISHKNVAIDALRVKEAELKKELTEKELLLNEIHHRVKNNLQMLSSLIMLRQDYKSPDTSSDIISRITEQIHSISLIYEQVYQQKLLSGINIDSYIHDIAAYLHCACPEPERIDLSLKIENRLVSIDLAVPIGIIINEILSNAFTHAFPDGRGGRIEVRFSSEGGGNSLIIEDNGIGFDQDKTGSNLGLDLIDMLSEQLGGDLKITSEPGRTKFSLSFR